MSSPNKLAYLLLFTIGSLQVLAQSTIHVWEMKELAFTSEHAYDNPYTDVDLWIELSGPGFNKKVYGFWDGGDTFKVRLVATQPGVWKWTSHSNSDDPGLTGKSGSFTALEWSQEDKQTNPTRRGFLRPTANQHALIHADSTPFFAMGSNRFKWYEDTVKRPIGPDAGFKDYVRYRKQQGFNWINVIAAFPNWKTDDSSYYLRINDEEQTLLRSAWEEFGTNSAKNMDNEGGRPFHFPGKIPGYEDYFPDMDRINPEYFKYIDRKIAYLNQHGFIPFLETSRRDASLLWQKYHKWPDSFSRYLQYFYARYHAYNLVIGPVHLDIISGTVSPQDYTDAINQVEEKYGPLPFGNLLSANANPSTYENWGDSSWVSLHQIGNKREHNNYWYLTEIYYSKFPKPALNAEPYYAGYKDNRSSVGVKYTRGAEGGTDRDSEIVHSTMYGSVLSGGFAGYVYGAEGIWGGDIEPEAPTKMWDAFTWKSAAQVKYLKDFIFSIGDRYVELEPNADLVSPNKTHELLAYDGWAYCTRTPDKNIFLAYFEKDCPPSDIRGAHLNSVYRGQWFNPRDGRWQDVAINQGKLVSSRIGIIQLPPMPSNTGWALKLTYLGSLDDFQSLQVVKRQANNQPALGDLKFYLKEYYPYSGIAIILVVFLAGIIFGIRVARKGPRPIR